MKPSEHDPAHNPNPPEFDTEGVDASYKGYWKRVGRAHRSYSGWGEHLLPTRDDKLNLAVFDLGDADCDIEPARHWLILEAPTGVGYSTQVGGLNCEHPVVEGHIINCNKYPDDPIAEELWKFAERTCKVGCHGGPLPEDLGKDPIWNPLNEVLHHWPLGTLVTYDPRRAKFGMECFVPVVAYTEHQRTWESPGFVKAWNAWLILGGNCD